MKHLTDQKQAALLSTKKALGTLTKVSGMVDDDVYCPEIIQQIDAAIGLLKSTKKHLLRGHLEHCLENKIKENKIQTVKELIKIYNLQEK